MSKIVVCKKFRLIEQSKGLFVLGEMRKETRSAVKISEEDMNNFNSIATKTGVLYEIDEVATKERDLSLEPKPDRKALLLEAAEMGLEFAKNIKTDQLINLIEENK